MYRWLLTFGLPVVAMACMLLGAVHLRQTSQPAPMLEPPGEPLRSPYSTVIAAPGLVEPRGEANSVGAALSGIVLEAFVTSADVGTQVKAGDPLFRVDDRHLRAQLAVDEAELAAAEARHLRLTHAPRAEELPPLEAAVRSAEAARNLALDHFERTQSLRSSGAVTSEEAEQAHWALEQAIGQQDRTRAELHLKQAGSWQEDILMALRDVAVAKSRVDQTRIQIERAMVRSPIDGEILKVDVRVGQAVAATPSESLLVVGDTSRMHVRAQVDEHDIGRLEASAKATAYARGNPHDSVKLVFVRVEPYVVPKRSLTGDNRERIDTRVLPVIFEITEAADTVFVGQQLDVMIEATAVDQESPVEAPDVAQPSST